MICRLQQATAVKRRHDSLKRECHLEVVNSSFRESHKVKTHPTDQGSTMTETSFSILAPWNVAGGNEWHLELRHIPHTIIPVTVDLSRQLCSGWEWVMLPSQPPIYIQLIRPV